MVTKTPLATKGELLQRERLRNKRKQQGSGNVADMETSWYKFLGTGCKEDLFREIRAYAFKKLWAETQEYDMTTETYYSIGTSNGDADDYAQRVCLVVLEKFDKFEGSFPQFRSWLKNICQNMVMLVHRDIESDRERFVPLTVEVEVADGVIEEVDNPALYECGFNATGVSIPNSIQGVDREIVAYIANGQKYAEIGSLLGLSEDAVKKRVQRLWARTTAERDDLKAKRDAKRAAADKQHNQAATHMRNSRETYTDAVYARLERLQQD